MTFNNFKIYVHIKHTFIYIYMIYSHIYHTYMHVTLSMYYVVGMVLSARNWNT